VCASVLTKIFTFRLAYRGGVTTAISAPSGTFLQGVSTAFSPGAAHARVENASIVDEVALHVAVSMNAKVGVSTQIAALRNMLFGKGGDVVLRTIRKVCTFHPFPSAHYLRQSSALNNTDIGNQG
jgi:hypothetical protein